MCPSWLNDLENKSLIKARALASEMMITMLVIEWICYSGCLQHRLSNPFERPPWRSRIWVAAACITACLQAGYFFAVAAAHKSLHLLFSALSFRTLIYVLAWMFLVCGTVEIFRHYNAKAHIRSQTLLRLEFDTRLGMHSPRYNFSEDSCCVDGFIYVKPTNICPCTIPQVIEGEQRALALC